MKKENILAKAIKNISLFAASITVTFVLSELALRIFLPDKGGELIAITFSKDFVKKDASLGISGVPFAKGVCYNCETKVNYQHNSQGFRDKERTANKVDSRYRAMVLGDSFVWGVGVDQDKTFTSLLENNNKNIEVINAAIPGWATNSEYLYLESNGLAYKPAMVIVVFCVENDAIGNGDYERNGFPDYVNPSLAQDKTNKTALLKFIQDHSRIYRLWKRKRRDLKIAWGLTPVFTEYSKDSLDWKATIKWIDKIEELSKKYGFKLLFVIDPARSQFFVKNSPDNPQKMLDSYLDSKNISYIDLFPVFLEYKKNHRNDWGYFKYDGHWNERGHKIVADKLSDFISNKMDN